MCFTQWHVQTFKWEGDAKLRSYLTVYLSFFWLSRLLNLVLHLKIQSLNFHKMSIIPLYANVFFLTHSL